MSVDLNPITPDLVKQGMKSIGTFALGKTLGGGGVVTVTLILGAATVAALSYGSFKLLQKLGKDAIKPGAQYLMDCRAASKDVKAFESSPRARKTLEIFKLEKAIAKKLPKELKDSLGLSWGQQARRFINSKLPILKNFNAVDPASQDLAKVQHLYQIYKLRKDNSTLSWEKLKDAKESDLNVAQAKVENAENDLNTAKDTLKTCEIDLEKSKDAFALTKISLKNFKEKLALNPSDLNVQNQLNKAFNDFAIAEKDLAQKEIALKNAQNDVQTKTETLETSKSELSQAQTDFDLASVAVDDPNISRFLLTDSTTIKSDLTERFEKLDGLYCDLDKAPGDYSIPEARKFENISEELDWKNVEQKNIPDKLALDFEVEANKYELKYGMTSVPGAPPSFKVFIQGEPKQIEAALNAFNSRTLGMTKPKALSASERVAVIAAREKGAMERNQKLREALGREPELAKPPKTKVQDASL